MLDVKSVSVSLEQKRVLNSISFSAAKGELIGLIGPNGVGKSTLLNACAALLPSDGVIEIEGKTLDELTPRELASITAYLPQTRDINWPIPVRTVIGLGRQTLKSMGQKFGLEDFEAIHSAMQALDIMDLRDRPANQLSGGEKACVLMARALAQEPKILLADEPVAGLDPAHSLSLMAHLKKMTQGGMTVIVVMHDLMLAGQFCDRLICLHKGRIANMGTAKQVLNMDTLKKVYGVKAVKARSGDLDLYIPVSVL